MDIFNCDKKTNTIKSFLNKFISEASIFKKNKMLDLAIEKTDIMERDVVAYSVAYVLVENQETGILSIFVLPIMKLKGDKNRFCLKVIHESEYPLHFTCPERILKRSTEKEKVQEWYDNTRLWLKNEKERKDFFEKLNDGDEIVLIPSVPKGEYLYQKEMSNENEIYVINNSKGGVLNKLKPSLVDINRTKLKLRIY